MVMLNHREKWHSVKINFRTVREDYQTKPDKIRKDEPPERNQNKLYPFINVHQVWK